MGHSLVWLLQWPVRAAILLLITRLPLGVEMVNFPIALVSALVIGLAGTVLVWPLRLLLEVCHRK